MISKRIDNMKNEENRFYLESYILDKNKHKFTMINMKDESKPMTIIINEGTTSISCSCMDFKFRCSKIGIPCKHCCYILMNGCKLTSLQISTLDIRNLEISLIRPYLEIISKMFTTKITIVETKVFEDNEICAICLMNDNIDLISCEGCHKLLHRQCINIWLQRRKTCPLCVRIWISNSDTKIKLKN